MNKKTQATDAPSLHQAVLSGDNDRLRDEVSIGTRPSPSNVAVIAEFLKLLIAEEKRLVKEVADARRWSAEWTDGARVRQLRMIRPASVEEADILLKEIQQAEIDDRRNWHARAGLPELEGRLAWVRAYAPSLFGVDPPADGKLRGACSVQSIIDFSIKHKIDLDEINGWMKFGRPPAQMERRRRARIVAANFGAKK